MELGLCLEREALKPHWASLALLLQAPFRYPTGVRAAEAGTQEGRCGGRGGGGRKGCFPGNAGVPCFQEPACLPGGDLWARLWTPCC